MRRDHERVSAIERALEESHLDALVVSLPANVLMMTGYWPVTGASVAVAKRGAGIQLIVPEDEEELACKGWADELFTYRPSTLEQITTTAEQLRGPIETNITKSMAGRSRIGFEHDMAEPFSYASIHLQGRAIETIFERLLGAPSLQDAGQALSQLRSIKTAAEISRIETACELADLAFRRGASKLKPGMTEFEAAALFQVPLSTALPKFPDVERAGGFVSCMSGPNSALAGAAYARSRTRRIAMGDLVLVHCNSYADGFWTDVTRTYSVGQPDGRAIELLEAVFEARRAAMTAVQPGVKASQVDDAARGIMRARGFAREFTHSTGHGVGFSAIDGNAPPRLHPKSTDEIQAGMTFNIEPAVYVDVYGGLRHCDMVMATKTDGRLLTGFQCRPEELILEA